MFTPEGTSREVGMSDAWRSTRTCGCFQCLGAFVPDDLELFGLELVSCWLERCWPKLVKPPEAFIAEAILASHFRPSGGPEARGALCQCRGSCCSPLEADLRARQEVAAAMAHWAPRIVRTERLEAMRESSGQSRLPVSQLSNCMR